MKFECDSCHAQYMIADEKVGKRGVKVKCKRCSHVIIVRPDGAKADAKGDVDAEPKAEAKPEPKAEAKAAAKATDNSATESLLRDPALGLDDDDDDDPATKVEARPQAPVADTEAHDRGSPPASDDADATHVGGYPAPPPDYTEPPRAEQAERTVVTPPPAPAPVVVPAPVAMARPAPLPEPAPSSTVVADAPPAGALAAPSQAPSVAGESSIGDALDDQLAGAFNSMFDGGNVPGLEEVRAASSQEEQRGPTKVLDADSMNELRRQALGGGGSVDRDALDLLRRDLGSSAGGASLGDDGGMWNDRAKSPKAPEPKAPLAGADDGPADPVWHAAVDDQEIGPTTLADLGRYIESGRLDRQTLVWKAGMDDWLPAGDVPAVRGLFDKVPAPKIAPIESTSGKLPRKQNSFEVGAPIDDIAGGSPFDNAPPFSAEQSDPAWRPHGLTDVYQAANLAEAAAGGGGAGSGLIGGSAGLAARPSTSAGSAADSEWRPSASSALASLVNDEMDRMSKGPMPAADDELDAPRLADAGLSPSLPFSNLVGGAALDAGGEVGDLGGRSRATTLPPTAASPTLSSPAFPAMGMGQPGFGQAAFGQPGFGQSGFAQPFAPPAPPPPQRSPMLYLGIAGVAVLVLMLGVVAWGMNSFVNKVADKGQPQVVVVGPNGLPLGAGGVPVGAGAAVTPPPPVAAVPPPPATDPASAAATTPPPATTPPADTAGAQVAAVTPPPGETAPKGDPKPTAVKVATRTEPTPRPEPTPKAEPKTTKAGGCDPVLDFDCKPAGGVQKAAPAAKETLEKGDILPVVRDSLPKVKACGSKAGASGQIKMTWKIGKDGRPADVSIADSKWGGTPVGACVVGVVKGMRFPSYSGKAPPPVSIPLPLQ